MAATCHQDRGIVEPANVVGHRTQQAPRTLGNTHPELKSGSEIETSFVVSVSTTFV
jgi:hypothetical protein